MGNSESYPYHRHTCRLLPKARSTRTFLSQRKLAHYLNRPIVEWVGNHGVNACLSLVDIGVSSDKIIPWDWPPLHRPSDYAPRKRSSVKTATLLYVGSVTQAKGVEDLLIALARLRSQGIHGSAVNYRTRSRWVNDWISSNAQFAR